LVLLQLPKKDAGAAMAFGGGATDALFGAGSGNVLTKITKYAAGIFFGLALVMAWTTSHQHQTSGGQSLQEELMKSSPAPAKSPISLPVTAPPAAPSGNSGLLQLPNVPPAQTSAPTPIPANHATSTGTNK